MGRIVQLPRLQHLLVGWAWAMAAVSGAVAARIEATATSTTSAYIGPCTRAAYSIPNGGFENGHLAPWYLLSITNGINASVVPARDDSDGHAAHLVAQAAFAIGGIQVDGGPHALCGGTAYEIYFEYRAAGNASNCLAYLNFNNATTSAYIYFTGLPANAPFQSARFRYANRAQTTFTLAIFIRCFSAPAAGGLVVLDIDSIEIAAVESLEPAGCPKAHVTVPNGDFESGVLAPWTIPYGVGNRTEVGVVYNPSNPLGGSYNVRMDFDNPTREPRAPEGFQLAVNVSGVCVAYEYVVSFAYEWVLEDGPLPPGTSAQVYLFTCSSQTIYPTKGWQTTNTTCVAENNAPDLLTVALGFLPYDASTNTTTYYPSFAIQFDNFKVELATRK